MIPAWAVTAFAFAFLMVFSIASWGIKQAVSRVHNDVGKLDVKIDDVKSTVNSIDRRVVRVETIIDGGASRRRADSSVPLPPAA